jgi:hypothetical protein
MHPYYHASSGVKTWGGLPAVDRAIRDFLDSSKEFLADFRHRALDRHAKGVFEFARARP